jgi:hypothetical protein
LAGAPVHAGTYTVLASFAGSQDYTSASASGTFIIAPAPLSITADNKTMTYGGPLPTLTASYSGFVNGDTAASLTSPPTLSTLPANSRVGTYSITVSGAVDPDYAIAYVNGTLTITPAPLTISADNQTKVYGASLPALTASFRTTSVQRVIPPDQAWSRVSPR